jgi:uncharacterized damage-inducible protein DinB
MQRFATASKEHTPVRVGVPIQSRARRQNMKKAIMMTMALALLNGISANATEKNRTERQMQSAASEDKTAPSYDMKAQALVDLQDMQKKYTQLAQSIPADKFTWRPEAGVRSVSELFLHVAAANYNIPTMMTGTAADPDFQKDGYEKSTTDRTKIVDQLNKSFAYAIAAVQKMSNADFAKAEKKLGPDANDGDVIYILVTHNHEHLGQSIAYARVNGVTPPWTEAQKKKDKPAAD